MITSRIKVFVLSGLLTLLLAGQAHAQDSADRDASFLPPPGTDSGPPDIKVPALNPAAAAAAVTVPAPAPSNINPPTVSAPVELSPLPSPPPAPVFAPPPQPIVAPVQPPSPPPPAQTNFNKPQPAAPPDLSTPPPMTSTAPEPPPVIIAPPAPTPPTPAPAAVVVPPPAPVEPTPIAPVDLGKPVESGTLSDINPEAIGLFSPKEGGLGAAMWKGTPRDLVERVLPMLNLPTASPILNNLAQRFLLTTADVPSGTPAGGTSLTAMRVKDLVALGDAKAAWRLASIAKPDQIDDATLRLTATAAVNTSEGPKICDALPDLIKTHTDPEWLKLLMACQLTAKDTKAASVTLDLLRAQNVKDDAYFLLVERDILSGKKEFPRQLTPLKPLNFALVKLTDISLRSEIYAHPDAAVIPGLLLLKSKDDNARLALAERAADHGLITAAELEEIYNTIPFPGDQTANAVNSNETGPRLHALLYQASTQDKAPRIDLAAKYLQNTTASNQKGAQAQVMADIVGMTHASDDYNIGAAAVARIFIMAGKPELALEWLKQAQHAATGMPGVAEQLHDVWPLAVFSGLVADSDYASNLGKWLDKALESADPDGDGHPQREAASILMLLEADGFAVPEEDWAKVIGPPASDKHPAPPAVILERLRSASTGSKRGEAVMLSLLLAGTDEPSFLSTLYIVRALRLTGLTADAATLAREAAAQVLAPPAK